MADLSRTSSKAVATQPPIPAAQYVRMSTEHQHYSIENQKDAIAIYAAIRGYEIVRTYIDAGRSGLSIAGRAGLRQLIADVCSGNARFEAILVYDVSRWGRFQDTDESAHYEFICRQMGVAVHYCAEAFENDGSISSTILKSIKRAMAGEYSRALSTQVTAAHYRLARLGYVQSSTAGYGLRRQLVDRYGRPKGILEVGERKNIRGDRVILVPGPPEEVATVRRIFRLYAYKGWSMSQIAAALNAEGKRTEEGQPWAYYTIGHLLSAEKYIGNNVYGRVSTKFHTPRVYNPPETWARADGVFEPIVSRKLFDAVQRRKASRVALMSNDQLLRMLADLLAKYGRLTRHIIDAEPGMPAANTYRARFGSIARAYDLIGYTEHRCLQYIGSNRRLRASRPALVSEVAASLRKDGASVETAADGLLLHVDGRFSLTAKAGRCRCENTNHPHWLVPYDKRRQPDFMVVARMDTAGEHRRDYCLVPRAAYEHRHTREIDRANLRRCWHGDEDLTGLYGRCLALLSGQSSLPLC